MMTYYDFEKLLAYYCAPSLVGIKPANLFVWNIDESIMTQHIERFHLELSTSPIHIKILNQINRHKVMFVYYMPLLESFILNPRVQKYLDRLGYPTDNDIDNILNYLCLRLLNTDEYPHEIGIFLGYPLDDVIGFIENHGKHYKSCGYWKVYSNEKQTLELFADYTRCRIQLYQKVSQGFTLRELHNQYSSQTNQLHKDRLV